MSRFDYVKYDDIALTQQTEIKEKMLDLEVFINTHLDSPRAKALILTKLEEAYAWCGKAIRDDQIARNGAADLQEERGNE